MKLKTIARNSVSALDHVRGYCSCTIEGQRFKCDPRHPGFWRNVSAGRWEPETFSLFRKLLRPEHTFFDVGAWIGPTAMYAATRCRQVFAFEPDPGAYYDLLFNLRSNKLNNVIPFNMALSSEDGFLSMATKQLGNATTRVDVGNVKKEEVTVPTLAWKTFVKMYPSVRADFINMDIEGAEFSLIPEMKDYLEETKAMLYLSTHQKYFKPEKRAELMQSLVDNLSFYPEVYFADMKKTTIRSLLDLDSFGTYLLKF